MEYTWNRSGNQIDHILVTMTRAKVISGVRAFRGANADLDHNLVVAIMKQNMVVRSKGERSEKIWDVDELSDEVKKKSMRLNAEWGVVEECVLLATNKVIGWSKNISKNNWFNDECVRSVK